MTDDPKYLALLRTIGFPPWGVLSSIGPRGDDADPFAIVELSMDDKHGIFWTASGTYEEMMALCRTRPWHKARQDRDDAAGRSDQSIMATVLDAAISKINDSALTKTHAVD